MSLPPHTRTVYRDEPPRKTSAQLEAELAQTREHEAREAAERQAEAQRRNDAHRAALQQKADDDAEKQRINDLFASYDRYPAYMGVDVSQQAFQLMPRLKELGITRIITHKGTAVIPVMNYLDVTPHDTALPLTAETVKTEPYPIASATVIAMAALEAACALLVMRIERSTMRRTNEPELAYQKSNWLFLPCLPSVKVEPVFRPEETQRGSAKYGSVVTTTVKEFWVHDVLKGALCKEWNYAHTVTESAE